MQNDGDSNLNLLKPFIYSCLIFLEYHKWLSFEKDIETILYFNSYSVIKDRIFDEESALGENC